MSGFLSDHISDLIFSLARDWSKLRDRFRSRGSHGLVGRGHHEHFGYGIHQQSCAGGN